jgi:hypothetical protein
MNKTAIVIFFAVFGSLSLITGVVFLVRKEYFYARLKHKDFLAPASIHKVTGKIVRSNGIVNIVFGIILLCLSVSIYLWGS